MICKFQVKRSKSDAVSDRRNKHTNQEHSELSENFYTDANQKTGAPLHVTLNSAGIFLRIETNGNCKEQLISLSDIIGSRCMTKQKHDRQRVFLCSRRFVARPIEDSPSNSSVYLHIYAYVMKCHRRERTVLTLRFQTFDKYEDNYLEAEKWHYALRMHKTALTGRTDGLHYQQPVLVLLNPKSGAGKAREYFQQQVESIFCEADLPYDLHVTKRPNYAKEFVYANWSGSIPRAWRAIILISGDGLFSEVINGLLQLSNWQEVMQKIPIGIIPCGSRNALARSIAHLYNEPYYPKPIVGATLTVLSGNTTLMDVVRVETRTQVMFSFLSVGWGLMSEMVLKSERVRGIQRFKLWSVVQRHLRSHHGKISYLPVSISTETNLINRQVMEYHREEKEDTEDATEKTKITTEAGARRSLSIHNAHASDREVFFATIDSDDNADNDFYDVTSMDSPGNLSRSNSFFSVTSRKSTFYSTAESTYESISCGSIDSRKLSDGDESTCSDGDDQRGELNATKRDMDRIFGPMPTLTPSLIAPLPDTWITEEGNFIMVQAAYRTHLSADCYIAPASTLNDGIIYLVIIREGVSRSQLVDFLLNISSGIYLLTENHNSFIKVVPVSAFRLEPTENDGVITVDGKRVDCGAIQGEIFPGIIKVMVPK